MWLFCDVIVCCESENPDKPTQTNQYVISHGYVCMRLASWINALSWIWLTSDTSKLRKLEHDRDAYCVYSAPSRVFTLMTLLLSYKQAKKKRRYAQYTSGSFRLLDSLSWRGAEKFEIKLYRAVIVSNIREKKLRANTFWIKRKRELRENKELKFKTWNCQG